VKHRRRAPVLAVAAAAEAEAVAAAALRNTVESVVRSVEDIQPVAAVRIRQNVRTNHLRSSTETATFAAGTDRILEVYIMLALEPKQHRDWVPERQLHAGLMLPLKCREAEPVLRSSVGPCS